MKKVQPPLQRRIKWLTESLGYDLRDVCASNLIFMQSRGATGIQYPTDADLCWPMQEDILDAVKPKLILAFGNSDVSPYGYLKRQFQGKDEFVPSGHGSWQCKGFEAVVSGRKSYVAGLPHLSRYSPIDKDGVVEWLRSHL